MSPSKYVQEAVHNVEEYLDQECNGRKLLKRALTPMLTSYRPELDVTPGLDAERASASYDGRSNLAAYIS
jgi:hypothetical protein